MDKWIKMDRQRWTDRQSGWMEKRRRNVWTELDKDGRTEVHEWQAGKRVGKQRADA